MRKALIQRQPTCGLQSFVAIGCLQTSQAFCLKLQLVRHCRVLLLCPSVDLLSRTSNHSQSGLEFDVVQG